MYVIYNQKHHLHQPIGELYHGKLTPHQEQTQRLDNVYNYLKNNKYNFYNAHQFSNKYIKKTHHADYLKFLNNNTRTFPSVFKYFYDTYTPHHQNALTAARAGVNSVLTGAELIKNKKTNCVYIASRPPGHHAMHKMTGGYCYYNNAAIAANYLNSRVAILDLDVHHGNGAQDIFYNNENVLTVSLHANPDELFPHFMGYENENNKSNYNFCFPPNTDLKNYLPRFKQAVSIIKKFNPEYLIIAAGFDTYYQDPIGNFKFKIKDYKIIGQLIHQLNLRTLITQEGGYHPDYLPKCVHAFLNEFK